MISVIILTEGPYIKGFQVSGHAGMAEHGKDIVCAGVSALTQTALLGLNEYLHSKVDWSIDDSGYLKCQFQDGISDLEKEKAQIILHTLELGLHSMEESYSQHLKVSRRRWTNND